MPPKIAIGPSACSGTWPLCSSACHAISRKWRCCGSVSDASSGEMPKKPASNSAASVSTPRAGT
jgi:hypothetical protein